MQYTSIDHILTTVLYIDHCTASLLNTKYIYKATKQNIIIFKGRSWTARLSCR